MMDSRDEKELGKLAYDAYVESVGGVAFNGDRLPPFEGVPLKINVAWIAAARAVASAVGSERE